MRNPNGELAPGKPFGDHGSPEWAEMNIYQNTFVMASYPRRWGQYTLNATSKERPRRVFNNIFVHLGGMPRPSLPPVEHSVQIDGNLYWEASGKERGALLGAFRSSTRFEESKRSYEPGWEAKSPVANPKFVRFSTEPSLNNGYRLSEGSPAVKAGVVLPENLPDPLRPKDGAPDIGALPLGSNPLQVGRLAR